MKPEEVHDEGGTSIVLFSGGLDSLAGALHELNDSNRHVVLVSHRNLPTMGRRQGVLAERLPRDFPKRVTHVWIDNSLTSKLDSDDETQRTRTFFFTAMAAVAAHIDKSDRIRFYAEPTRLPEPRPDSPSGLETVHIAVDERRQCILISDRPDLSGPTIFPLMKFLIHAWGQDRAEGRLRRNHRSFRGKVLAGELGLSEATAISQTVRRIRVDLAEAAQASRSFDGGPDAVVESTGRGYRLNPALLVVSLEEFLKL